LAYTSASVNSIAFGPSMASAGGRGGKSGQQPGPRRHRLYAKLRVEDSEVTKRRKELDQRLANLQRWAESARVRGRRASRLYTRRCRETKEQAKALYRMLNDHQRELERQGEMTAHCASRLRKSSGLPMPRLPGMSGDKGGLTTRATRSMTNANAPVASNGNSYDRWKT
jgi:hypothetical protein